MNPPRTHSSTAISRITPARRAMFDWSLGDPKKQALQAKASELYKKFIANKAMVDIFRIIRD